MENSLKNDFNLNFYIRYALAFGLLFMGIDKFVVLNPLFKFTGEAEILYNALDRSGFILPFIGCVEIIAGSLLIRKNTTPLGLVILLPFSISTVLFHLFLAPSQILPAFFLFTLNAILIYRARAIYSPIFRSIIDGEDEVKESIAKINWIKKTY
jgi:putative oxidoreductase